MRHRAPARPHRNIGPGSSSGMRPNRARDDVERWLIQGSHRFASAGTDEDSFRFLIRQEDSLASRIEIFEPKSQPGVLVIGAMCPLKNSQNARYLRLSGAERRNLERRIADYCRSIRAVHRLHEEDGRRTVGVYVVLDRKEQINQAGFAEAVRTAAGLGDMASRYLLRAF